MMMSISALAGTGVNFPVELVIAIAAVLVLGGAAAAVFAGRRRRNSVDPAAGSTATGAGTGHTEGDGTVPPANQGTPPTV